MQEKISPETPSTVTVSVWMCQFDVILEDPFALINPVLISEEWVLFPFRINMLAGTHNQETALGLKQDIFSMRRSSQKQRIHPLEAFIFPTRQIGGVKKWNGVLMST